MSTRQNVKEKIVQSLNTNSFILAVLGVMIIVILLGISGVFALAAGDKEVPEVLLPLAVQVAGGTAIMVGVYAVTSFMVNDD